MDFTIKVPHWGGKAYLAYGGKTPSTPEEAWSITLQKWASLAELPYCIEDGMSSTCGLCMYHVTLDLESGEWKCGNCPIAAIGFEHCIDTPYHEYRHGWPEAAIEEFWFLLALYAAWSEG